MTTAAASSSSPRPYNAIKSIRATQYQGLLYLRHRETREFAVQSGTHSFGEKRHLRPLVSYTSAPNIPEAHSIARRIANPATPPRRTDSFNSHSPCTVCPVVSCREHVRPLSSPSLQDPSVPVARSSQITCPLVGSSRSSRAVVTSPQVWR